MRETTAGAGLSSDMATLRPHIASGPCRAQAVESVPMHSHVTFRAAAQPF